MYHIPPHFAYKLQPQPKLHLAHTHLGRPDRHPGPHAQVREDVQHLRVPPELLQEGYDDLDVLLAHHVQGLGGVVEDAVEDVHHASPFPAGLREEKST